MWCKYMCNALLDMYDIHFMWFSDAMLSRHTQMKQEVLPNEARKADVAIKNPENPEFLALRNLEIDESGDQAYYQVTPCDLQLLKLS